MDRYCRQVIICHFGYGVSSITSIHQLAFDSKQNNTFEERPVGKNADNQRQS